ncbi:adenine phosphoribosyltransferase [Vulgatibacter incomptus]|uniref:Adenine phosphoribosyltransferase n=1 Tax=Vulgatibacter incomptus TaxID=1391653 RepID=A0A0K1PGG9_9BACT|nr:adenine phosphoribosyltransferase [Vulgatibacter incomptus]AKU92602.1 Adenine phosphoribosyltransferase [Vulgatibacter incomptus]
MELRERIRDVVDFPHEGIVFKDITPLIADPVAFRTAIDRLAEAISGEDVDRIVGIEARGFIFGSALACVMGKGFSIVRKPGKLPWRTDREEYSLEYGKSVLEIHEDAVQAGERVVIVDDLLATGGTAGAASRLVERRGGVVTSLAFVVELAFLGGREQLEGRRVHSLVEY